MPFKILVLTILFALFIFCCGAGHLLRCLNQADSNVFKTLNWVTAMVSLATALYLLPLVPFIMEKIDESLDFARIKEETVQSKMQFMAYLCHEIRNPLFAITSSITFVLDGYLTHDQKDAVTCIQQSAELMLRLVNDVLQISKFESGKFQLDNHHFDLQQLVESVSSSMRAQCWRRHEDKVEFTLNLSKSVPHIVSGDSARFAQIMYNILSNANKFTEQGSICFNVSSMGYTEALELGCVTETNFEQSYPKPTKSLRDDNDLEAAESGKPMLREMVDPSCASSCQAVVVVEVSDTGLGIPKENIQSVFEPYAQSKLSDYRKHGGTGLGLPIVSKIVQMMGGTVTVNSQVGVGTTFHVYIPVTVVASSRPSNDIVLDLSSGEHPYCSGSNEIIGLEERVFAGSARQHVLPLQDEPSPTRRVASFPDLSESTLSTSESVATTEEDGDQSASDPLSRFDLPHNGSVVLVVDDNIVNLKLIGKMLSHFNLEYRLARNGQEAVDAIMESRNVTDNEEAPHYGLVLMDISMPVMDGCEATRRIRAFGIKDLPIVALTANALDGTQAEALDAGATEFATKPILRDQLREKCWRYLVEGTKYELC